MNDTVMCIDTPNARLAYRSDGPQDAEPLLLLQRFRGTMDDWDPRFIQCLAARRRVIRFDNAGIGRSTGEVPGSVDAMALVALDLIDALDLGQIDVLGWSLGGYAAQSLTLHEPDRVRRLIVAGSGPGGVSEGPRPDARVGEIALNDRLSREDLVFLFSARTESSRKSMDEALARIDDGRTGSPPVTLDAATRQREAVGKWWRGEGAARARLPELLLPVLVANGVDDIMVPAISSFLISQEAPNVKLVLYPDSGHGFLFQHAARFVREIEDFLSA